MDLFGQLKTIVKEDASSQESFIKIQKALIRRARATAIIMGSFTVITLLAIVYSIDLRSKATEEKQVLNTEIQNLKSQLNECMDQ